MMDNNNNLVGGFNLPLLKNMSSSVGMMKFPICGEIKIHVPNHQAEFEWACWASPIFRYIQNYPNVPKPRTIYIYTLISICKFCVCDRITT